MILRLSLVFIIAFAGSSAQFDQDVANDPKKQNELATAEAKTLPDQQPQTPSDLPSNNSSGFNSENATEINDFTSGNISLVDSFESNNQTTTDVSLGLTDVTDTAESVTASEFLDATQSDLLNASSAAETFNSTPTLGFESTQWPEAVTETSLGQTKGLTDGPENATTLDVATETTDSYESTPENSSLNGSVLTTEQSPPWASGETFTPTSVEGFDNITATERPDLYETSSARPGLAVTTDGTDTISSDNTTDVGTDFDATISYDNTTQTGTDRRIEYSNATTTDQNTYESGPYGLETSETTDRTATDQSSQTSVFVTELATDSLGTTTEENATNLYPTDIYEPHVTDTTDSATDVYVTVTEIPTHDVSDAAVATVTAHTDQNTTESVHETTEGLTNTGTTIENLETGIYVTTEPEETSAGPEPEPTTIEEIESTSIYVEISPSAEPTLIVPSVTVTDDVETTVEPVPEFTSVSEPEPHSSGQPEPQITSPVPETEPIDPTASVVPHPQTESSPEPEATATQPEESPEPEIYPSAEPSPEPEFSSAEPVATGTPSGETMKGSVVVSGRAVSTKSNNPSVLATALATELETRKTVGNHVVEPSSVRVNGQHSEKYTGKEEPVPEEGGTRGYVVGIVIALAVLAICLMIAGLIMFNQKRHQSHRLRDDDYVVDDGMEGRAAKQWHNGNRDTYAGVNMYEMSETMPAEGRGNPAFQQDRTANGQNSYYISKYGSFYLNPTPQR